MQALSLPEHWFRDVKKIYVVESVDYYTRKGSTTVFIRYKPLWKFRRKLKFTRTLTQHDDAEIHERSPEAQAVIGRLKESLRPSFKKPLFDGETLRFMPKGDLAFFYRHAVVLGHGQPKNCPPVHWGLDF